MNVGKEEFMDYYTMRIDRELVKKLYLCRESLKTIGITKPMTVIVKEAVTLYLPKLARKILKKNGSILHPDEWNKANRKST